MYVMEPVKLHNYIARVLVSERLKKKALESGNTKQVELCDRNIDRSKEAILNMLLNPAMYEKIKHLNL